MKIKKKSLLLGLGLISLAPGSRAITNPVVDCIVTTVCANVTDPIKLAFAPDGTLFVGLCRRGLRGDEIESPTQTNSKS